MTRFWPAYPCMLLVAACTIQPTPQEYIDRQAGAAEQLTISEAEISRRLSVLPDILLRQDSDQVDLVLKPHRSVVFFAPEEHMLSIPPEDVGTILNELFGGQRLEVSEIAVAAGPQNNVAWFSVAYRSDEQAPAASGIVLSGVYRRLEGEWQLIQGHVSTFPEPTEPDSVTPPPQAP